MPPDVANTDRVINDGGVSNVGCHADLKRHHGRDDVYDCVVKRRVYDDQELRPAFVATDERSAHAEECDISGNRAHQCATAVVTAKGEKPSGTFQHQGMSEMRSRILATMAANMTDVGQTCEASSVSDRIATTMVLSTIMSHSSAAVPTTSAVSSTDAIAAYGPVTAAVQSESMSCTGVNRSN